MTTSIMANATAAPSPAAPSSQFATLLGSTIESIFHELLHSRSIYPPDSFVLHRHLGVRCHASRVPQVGDYIAEFLRVAIPSIVGGAGDSLSLIILEEEVANRRGSGNGERRDAGERTGVTRTVERFVFQFQMDGVIGSQEDAKFERIPNYDHMMDIEDSQENEISREEILEQQAKRREEMQKQHAMRRDKELALEARSQLERSMRECLLRVLALRKRRKRKDEKAENMSFKLCLHVAEDKNAQVDNNIVDVDADGTGAGRDANRCPELLQAVQNGEWLQPNESSCMFSSTPNGSAQHISKGLLRPIKDVNLPSCGMRMQLGLEVDPF